GNSGYIAFGPNDGNTPRVAAYGRRPRQSNPFRSGACRRAVSLQGITMTMTTPDLRRRPALPEWPLTVVEAFEVTPRMRRVVFTIGNLDAFDYRPGQALAMQVPLPSGETGRRDYTIRSLDRATGLLAIDFLLHGDTPAPVWARNAKAGDEIATRGPRGHTVFN